MTRLEWTCRFCGKAGEFDVDGIAPKPLARILLDLNRAHREASPECGATSDRLLIGEPFLSASPIGVASLARRDE